MLDPAAYLLMLLATLVGALAVDPLTFWMVRRGSGVYRSLKLATVLAAIVMLPGVAATLLLLLSFLGGAGAWGIAALPALFLAQYLVSPHLVLWGAKARRVGPGEEWLLDLLEEVKRASGYGGRVELRVAEVDEPNAFAISNAFKKVIVLHRGLARILSRDEIKAVIAHELGHIARNDNAYAYATSLTPYLVYLMGLAVLALGISLVKSKDLEAIAGGLLLSAAGARSKSTWALERTYLG